MTKRTEPLPGRDVSQPRACQVCFVVTAIAEKHDKEINFMTAKKLDRLTQNYLECGELDENLPINILREVLLNLEKRKTKWRIHEFVYDYQSHNDSMGLSLIIDRIGNGCPSGPVS